MATFIEENKNQFTITTFFPLKAVTQLPSYRKEAVGTVITVGNLYLLIQFYINKGAFWVKIEM